jgi:hypothetical protein
MSLATHAKKYLSNIYNTETQSFNILRFEKNIQAPVINFAFLKMWN